MSEPNSTEKPVFRVNETMYRRLLEWQKNLEQIPPEDSTSSTSQPTNREPQKNTNQNDHQA